MRRKTMLSLLLSLGIAVLPNLSEAGHLDSYREIILQGEYTIRYDNITPAPRVTNRDRMELFGSSGMAVERNDYLTNRQRRGIVVSSGKDKYEEVGDGVFDMCRLKKGGETFVFTKYKKGDGYEYFGSKKGKVEANSRNALAEVLSGESYGDPELSSMLNAMLPDSAKSANMPHYSLVKEGSLPNGLSYEDHKALDGGITHIIRYYFNGADLVKIASASYHKEKNGTLKGHKCIIKVNEFSSLPDRKLLSLPEGLEDVTKRERGK